MKTPRKSAVFSVLHLSSTHFGMPDWIRTSGLQSRSYKAVNCKLFRRKDLVCVAQICGIL